MISRVVGKPVFDRTGLTERYDIVLSFARLSLETGDVSNGNSPDLGGAPDLFTAVQEQLGLKLEPERQGVEESSSITLTNRPPQTRPHCAMPGAHRPLKVFDSTYWYCL
jgi:uncharacterized protein (TIGR03435 family)